jgi:hypothetical protein
MVLFGEKCTPFAKVEGSEANSRASILVFCEHQSLVAGTDPRIERIEWPELVGWMEAAEVNHACSIV